MKEVLQTIKYSLETMLSEMNSLQLNELKMNICVTLVYVEQELAKVEVVE